MLKEDMRRSNQLVVDHIQTEKQQVEKNISALLVDFINKFGNVYSISDILIDLNEMKVKIILNAPEELNAI
jgi:hypothetical protein